jgi:hypothetical protein
MTLLSCDAAGKDPQWILYRDRSAAQGASPITAISLRSFLLPICSFYPRKC